MSRYDYRSRILASLGDDGRKRIIARHVEPHTDSWWCRWWAHKLAPSEDEATYVYHPSGRLLGMLCERCGALAFDFPELLR